MNFVPQFDGGGFDAFRSGQQFQLRRHHRPPFWRRVFVLQIAAVLFAMGIFGCSILLMDAQPAAAFLPLGLIAASLATLTVLSAVYGSRPAIIAYFAILAFVIGAQFRARGAGEISVDWQSSFKFLLWLGAGVIGFRHMPPLRVMLTRPASACCLAYIVVALASSLYSPIPAYSFGCALGLLGLFAFAYTLTTYLTEARFWWTLLSALTVFNVAGWIVFYANPDLGTSEAWTNSGIMLRMCGLAGQATNLGQTSAFAIGAAFILWYKGQCRFWLAIVLGGFAFITLLKSDTRTAEISVIISIGVIIVIRSIWLVAAGTLTGLASLVTLQIFPQLITFFTTDLTRSGDPAEIYTLTGRLQIWSFAWRQISLSPILGYGYNSSKVVLGTHLGFEDGLLVDAAHNLYLQNLLSVGVVGTIPLVGLLIYICFKCSIRPLPTVCFTLVMTLISSITDSSTIGGTPTLATILLFVIAVWPELTDGSVSGRLAM